MTRRNSWRFAANAVNATAPLIVGKLAGYVFYTATGEEFDERAIKRKTNFVGESTRYDVYLLYESDLDYLRTRR